MHRNVWLYGVVLLIVGVWLAIHWPHHSLWYDEALTTWVARGPWDRLIRWCTEVDIQVPFHYVVLRGWMTVFGRSEFALHLLSAFCGLLAVAGVMAVARRFAGLWAALLAGLLLGLSAGFLWIAYEVRAYALALALFAWASVFLHQLILPHPPTPSPQAERGSPLRVWKSPSLRSGERDLGGEVKTFIAYSLLMLATLYTHYTGIGALAAHGVIILWLALRQRSWAIVRRMIPAGLIIGIGFAPWLPILLLRSGADRSFYTGTILPDQTIGTILSFKWLARDDFKWVIPDKGLSPLAPLVFIGLLILIIGVIAGWRGRWQRSEVSLIYGLSILILPILMIIVVVYFKPKLAGRYAWPAWVGLDMLLALGLIALLRRRALTMMATAVLLAIPWFTGQIGRPPDSDFRGAFAYVRAHWQSTDLLILRDGTLYPAADYYQSPQPYIGLPFSELTDATHVLHASEAVPILAQQSDTIRGVWLLSWQGTVMDPEEVTAGLLETVGTRQTALSYGDVGLEYYTLDRPLSTLQAPQIAEKPLATLPDGVILDSVQLAKSSPVSAGDMIIVHGWWRRHAPVSDKVRVSARLYGSDGTAYGQQDKPPAGWSYLPRRWPADTLILGRYELQVPPDAPDTLTVKLVIYSAENDFTPVEVTAGTVQVRR
ncbi:MAG: glycosyltransferase family 39 protein [Anaerolineae bacterium]|nr:glycosyltransferase family 39 protein [Anaerolineae bacterium]